MKTLQNNYTTPEQNKRLLDLGVPKWTADCVYIIYQKNSNEDYYILNVPLSHQSSIIDIVEKGNADYKDGNVKFCYCWSVGRLMEIYHNRDGIGIYSENPKFNGEPILIIRGWGYLTGSGGLHLSQEEAIQIQDEFGDYIVEQLNKSTV